MLIEGSVVTIAAIAWLFLRMWSEGELRQELLERGLDARAVRRAVRYGRAEEDGFVDIPIERAMKLLANKLPARATEDDRASRAGGLVDGGEPNSGRLFKKGGP